MAMLLFGALSWNLEMIIKSFISEQTIEEAFLIVNLFSCMKIDSLLSNPKKFANQIETSIQVLFATVFTRLSSRSASKYIFESGSAKDLKSIIKDNFEGLDIKAQVNKLSQMIDETLHSIEEIELDNKASSFF